MTPCPAHNHNAVAPPCIVPPPPPMIQPRHSLFLLSCQHLTAVCMHIFSFINTFFWHMHAHIHRRTCLRHTRTHTRSNAAVVTGFCSSFPLAEFPLELRVIRFSIVRKFLTRPEKNSWDAILSQYITLTCTCVETDLHTAVCFSCSLFSCILLDCTCLS